MAEDTKIEWTDATWNPITGCSVVSPGCTNCYAMKLAGGRLQHHPSRQGLTVDTKAGPVWTGVVRLNEAWILQPLQWKRPRKIFVCAHGDLFHESVPFDWIDRIFAVMALAPQHTFQVVTKRAARMREYITALMAKQRSVYAAACDVFGEGRTASLSLAFSGVAEADDIDAPWRPLPNVWLLVSVEDQVRADERIPELLATPAAARGVSYEPALGPVDFTPHLFIYTHDDVADLDTAGPPPELPWRDPATTPAEDVAQPRIDWIIAGGESGPGARPMHPDWVRQVRDDCAAAEVAFFFKQWGEYREVDHAAGQTISVDADEDFAQAVLAEATRPCWITAAGRVYRRLADLPEDETPCRLLEQLGKGAAGRELDGVIHDAMPSVAR